MAKEQEVICKKCNQKFLVRVTKVRQGHGIYCSKSCKAKHMTKAYREKLKKGSSNVG